MPDDEFEDVVRRTDPDRWLASRLVGDVSARSDLLTLYAFDSELARAVRVTSSSLMAQIRLTWWSEALEEVAGGGNVRRHPLAQRLCELVRRRRLPADLLADLIEGRIAVLGMAQLDMDAALAWAGTVGGSASVLAATILGAGDNAPEARPAGQLIGLGALVREGVVGSEAVASRLPQMLVEANASARRLPASAFPAVAPAALVPDQIRGRSASDLSRRLRLLWAAARGRV
ncbi:MAG TPA: squalene/phytoene synthase family protein [Caulobacteraceae bacterium]|nr:squalene/phytoene synthase family protein [Caulobacteraceae bacterium]